MNLENEVGYKYFRNEWQKASMSILYTQGLLYNTYENFFKQFGLTFQQYNALRILRDQFPKPVSTSFLREKLLDKMSDASRLVSRLSAKGFVTVTQNPSDKRLVNILVSDTGLKVLEGLDDALPELDQKLYGITEEEAGQVAQLLQKLRTSLKADSRPEQVNSQL
ncbi:MarR family winged helix-turn-helix transcriptional regulator [Pontibacter cellulosilyticus]|uniref:MarR family transcriptional regulator n=1 Tax=Pontibacter cellulosilyticus TaxID=1720253 RepID=A0A923N3E7_9BACT|nr:MarR family transcriptional regulator [Pontibacter cellulosilyticus]MBC5991753.1 MarR family transcriptional regulator [Pontibacter cellulosilyticus]